MDAEKNVAPKKEDAVRFFKKKRKEVKKKKEIPYCREGDKCPACGKKNAIRKRGDRISFGDGMAGTPFLRPEAFLPLACSFCKARFRKKSSSALLKKLEIFSKALNSLLKGIVCLVV